MLHTRTRRKFTTLRHFSIYFAISAFGLLSGADAADVSPPPILQWFETTYKTMQARAPDVFLAGYGAVWVPPPGRAGGSGNGTDDVGYDPFDRFDLGQPGHTTRYGTEDGLKSVATGFHRGDIDLHIDFVINHNGTNDQDTPGFVKAGDYPGCVVTLPVDPDGDFHSKNIKFANDPIRGRLDGLIDIDHSKNHRFIRSPVSVAQDDIPAGTVPAFGRLADVPNEFSVLPAKFIDNRRLYPDRNLPPILLFDPRTGEQNIQVFPFNLGDPTAGDPDEENAMGLLMRNAQWLVQVIGADGFRIDAARHVDGFVLDLFDRAVYRSSPRKLLDGSQKQIFSYCEAVGVDKQTLLTFNKKTIDPHDPGKIGANRDSLDFELIFRMQDKLSANGLANDWGVIRNATEDFDDDGKHNGSIGVRFAAGHDGNLDSPFLSDVANAYVLMHPGNAMVYYNSQELKGGFPRQSRPDPLGNLDSKLTRLVQIRATHGRGDYIERWSEKELFAFERRGSAVLLMNNRLDPGFDSRSLQVALAPGTPLLELTGNAANPKIDPNNDLPDLVVVKPDGTIDVRFPRNVAPNGTQHNSGYLIYGLAGPQAPAGLELTGVDHTEPGADPATAGPTALLADVSVIKGSSFQVKLQTTAVTLTGNVRDGDADGDNALIKVDGGRDINGNGAVDFRAPGDTDYGFEMFRDKSSPRIGPGAPGDGEFIQTIDATKLEKGLHFIEVRAFRHRTDGGPAIFTSLKKVISIQ
ncbi:MAG: hypothetical protein ACLQU5_35470 [Isosphaeraceae bacterium]